MHQTEARDRVSIDTCFECIPGWGNNEGAFHLRAAWCPTMHFVSPRTETRQTLTIILEQCLPRL